MDNLTKEQRSYNMSRIRSTDTKIEQAFFKLLDDNKISYVRHPKIFGKPDCQIKEKILIFVESDFWHGWRFKQWRDRLPQEYWVNKIERNIKRDKNKFRKLRKEGFIVVRIWGHQLKNKDKVISKMKTIINGFSS